MSALNALAQGVSNERPVGPPSTPNSVSVQGGDWPQHRLIAASVPEVQDLGERQGHERHRARLLVRLAQAPEKRRQGTGEDESGV